MNTVIFFQELWNLISFFKMKIYSIGFNYNLVTIKKNQFAFWKWLLNIVVERISNSV